MKNIIVFAITLLFTSSIFALDIIVKISGEGFEETINKLESRILEKGFRIIQKIDHSRAAEKQSLDLPPSYVIIFGNPAAGTLLMQQDPAVAYDLPLRIAIYENKNGEIIISYRNGEFLSKHYELDDVSEVLENMNNVLEEITEF